MGYQREYNAQTSLNIIYRQSSGFKVASLLHVKGWNPLLFVTTSNSKPEDLRFFKVAG